jgi:hypothetical protein
MDDMQIEGEEIIDNPYVEDEDRATIIAKLQETDFPGALDSADQQIGIQNGNDQWIAAGIIETVLLLTPNLSSFEFKTIGYLQLRRLPLVLTHGV